MSEQYMSQVETINKLIGQRFDGIDFFAISTNNDWSYGDFDFLSRTVKLFESSEPSRIRIMLQESYLWDNIQGLMFSHVTDLLITSEQDVATWFSYYNDDFLLKKRELSNSISSIDGSFSSQKLVNEGLRIQVVNATEIDRVFANATSDDWQAFINALSA